MGQKSRDYVTLLALCTGIPKGNIKMLARLCPFMEGPGTNLLQTYSGLADSVPTFYVWQKKMTGFFLSASEKLHYTLKNKLE